MARDQRRCVPDLCRTGPRADAVAKRHPCVGKNDPPDHFLILLTWTTSAATSPPPSVQLSGPPVRICGSCHPTARTLASLKTVPQTVFLTRLTHRAGLRQAQASAAKRRRTIQTGPPEQDRHPARPLHRTGISKLLRQLWLRFRMKLKRSKGYAASPEWDHLIRRTSVIVRGPSAPTLPDWRFGTEAVAGLMRIVSALHPLAHWIAAI